MKIEVKWSGKRYEVEVDADQSGAVLKAQLYTLTGVEPDRQKVLIKGGTLKDDTVLSAIGIKEGQSLMMMGTAGELPKAPAASVQFVEDMTETQLAKALKVPAGLRNLGNTCYMNATLQCLRAIPEMKKAMILAPKGLGPDSRPNLMPILNNLFHDLDNSGEAISPLVFLQMLRAAFPQFNERNNNGYMQQDAEECWGEIISALADRIPGLSGTGESVSEKKFVDQYMTGEMISTSKCDDAPNETATVSLSTFRQLKVNIGSGVSTYMLSDLAAGFIEKIEKTSPSLNRLATYTQSSKISRLPAYLTINFVRFQWKTSEGVKAKILKKVKFPLELDMSSLCTPELLELMRPAKEHLKRMDDAKNEAKKLKKANPNAMEVEDPAVTASEDQLSRYKELGINESLSGDVGANVSGQYDLVAVLTHVGRAADSGHYIGWAKNDKGEWWKFDDDTVSLVTDDEITKLEGGGDWHSAYICLYKAKML